MSNKKGFVLIGALIVVITLAFMLLIYVNTSINEINLSLNDYHEKQAFWIAEAGVEHALKCLDVDSEWRVGFEDVPFGNGSYSVDIVDSGPDQVQVISVGSVNPKKEIVVTVDLHTDVPCKAFDYAYFINNWAWYWGSTITCNGDARSNGRFDLVYRPTVNGHLYAGLEIDDHGYGIDGNGGLADHQHENQSRVRMPVQDAAYYMDLAQAGSGRVKVGNNVIFNKIFGNQPQESGNLVLVGTDEAPIIIDGFVYVTGDVVIKGRIKGRGTLYAGRNIYIADNIEYVDGPSTSRPSDADGDGEPILAEKDAWAEANKDKNLIGLFADENIVMGDYTRDSHYGYGGSDRWYSNLWLFGMGSEDVGRDGIPDTGDEFEGDGIFQSEYEDLDEDGIFDDNYNWSDIETQASITEFDNLPDGVSNFSDLAVNTTSKVEAVFYTNHAFAARTGYDIQFNGSVISKDEAIIYRNNLTMNYDERMHSRYGDKPWYTELFKPPKGGIKVKGWK